MCVSVTPLCSTLCDPMNHSPPGFCPWDSPGKNPGMGGHVLLQVIYLYICTINTYTFCTMIKMKKYVDIRIYICNYVYKYVNIYTHINVTYHVCMLLLSHFSHVRFCATPSLGFSRQEHWSGLPFPSPKHKSEKWKWSIHTHICKVQRKILKEYKLKL